MYVWLNNGTYGFLMGFGDEKGNPHFPYHRKRIRRIVMTRLTLVLYCQEILSVYFLHVADKVENLV